jgi:hypothetical protein
MPYIIEVITMLLSTRFSCHGRILRNARAGARKNKSEKSVCCFSEKPTYKMMQARSSITKSPKVILRLPEKKPYPVPRPKFPESMKPPMPRVQRCITCHHFKTEGQVIENTKAKQKLHTCIHGPCTCFETCPTRYAEGMIINIYIFFQHKFTLTLTGHPEEQERQAREIAMWKADKALWETDIAQKRKAVQEIKTQQKAEEERKKEENQRLREGAHVSTQNWGHILSEEDTYVDLLAIMW